MTATFEKSLKFGKIGESRIARWLMSKGYSVLPVYEKEINDGKGPQLFSATHNLIAPDMLTFIGNNVRWIEAKHKSVFSWHRNTSRWVTGINLRHYEDYMQVADKSPWPVWILFLHTRWLTKEHNHFSPIGLFGNELGYLRSHENHRSDKWGTSGMVYWSVDNLKKIAKLIDIP